MKWFNDEKGYGFRHRALPRRARVACGAGRRRASPGPCKPGCDAAAALKDEAADVARFEGLALAPCSGARIGM
jgi:hypothetical protein